MTNTKKKTIILGLDGVPYGLLKDLADKGVMPNTGNLISRGTFRKMRSSIPEISSVAWSSVITGRNPGEHGIFGFTSFVPNTYRLSFPNFNDLKSSTFWHRKKEDKHIIINVPSTYPARELNGVLISGFVSLDLEKAVYPDSVIPDLKSMDYRVDVDSGKAHESLELFMKDLNRTNEARITAYRYLWDLEWDTFMFVFTGTDRLMHFLWDAYEDEEHEYHDAFTAYFRRIDEIIGEITSKMDENHDLIMLSDHGFEKLEYDVYINHVLKEKGFLKLQDGNSGNFSDIGCETRAFALDPARIYVHLEEKYPRGSVDIEDKESIIKEITEIFENLEINGRKVIKHIYKKEDIYEGLYFDEAPDVVLVGESGFNLKAAINSKNAYSKGIFTGKHTLDDAFLFVDSKANENLVPENPNVCDVAGIMENLKQSSVNQLTKGERVNE